MKRLSGFLSLLRVTLLILMMFLMTAEIFAARFRRRSFPENVNRTVSVTPSTVTKTESSSGNELISPPGKTRFCFENLYSWRNKPGTPEEKRIFASQEYVLGMDFSSMMEKFPEKERGTFFNFLEMAEKKLEGEIKEKYKDFRPEFQQQMVKLAGKAYLECAPLLEVSAEVRQLSTLKLTSSEILAVNELLCGCLDLQEYMAVEGLNRFRMRSGLRPCLIDLQLCQAARGHSSDMRRYGFFSHTSPVRGKSSFTSRAHQYGVSASAENIYMGSSSGMAANNAWINSSGHRANMLGGYFRVGVGRVGGHFTQMFGR
ncbi:MAG: CAP domain-containing protein [Planctomycetia bacterium]|nr:CAP domain-containing protein [Planctomycetia bacterium]